MPSQEELDALIPLIDYTRLELDGDGLRARLPENMELDLGAVAKGYTGTYLAEQLRQAGVTSAILRLGGNIQAVGTRPDGKPLAGGHSGPGQPAGGHPGSGGGVRPGGHHLGGLSAVL